MRISTWKRRLLATALATTTVLGGVSLPAAADHEAPFDGPAHEYGDMVDYDLTFPVPDAVWYQDWFYAARTKGDHHGQDLFAPKGTPVVAAHDGTVLRINSSFVSPHEKPDGCCSVVLEHDDGWMTLYVHLDNDTPGTDDGQGWGIAPGLEIGDHVHAGDLIGFLGDSGSAEDTQPHLHFELRDPDGVIVNPFDALRASEGVEVCRVADPGPLRDLVASAGLIVEGDRGTEVEQIQRLADAFGYDVGPIDGIFGPKTAAAVRSLQDALGVTPDGIVGDETRAAVSRVDRIRPHRDLLDPDGRIIGWGDVGSDVGDLQELLAYAGYSAGSADGLYGPLTLDRVEAFQRDRGIDVDGVVGPGTRRALAAALGVQQMIDCPG
ncbi:MAG: peptidoglycan-binding protein [Acidimicrobiia bacterium]|nr:peptidoglycan-binding protein [Acidimicrobiia bacterium]